MEHLTNIRDKWNELKCEIHGLFSILANTYIMYISIVVLDNSKILEFGNMMMQTVFYH